jgi:hypothetical protein
MIPNNYITKRYLVPIQDFTEPWSDEKRFGKYGLTAEEIAFIESMIRLWRGSQLNLKEKS